MDITIKHTSDYIKAIRSNGRYAFTIDELTHAIPKSIKNIRKDLDRLNAKGEIINIRRGFYTILPPEYQNMGLIPVDYYIDDLMKYIPRNYYVGLLSAAMFHGAGHQQPQEFFVITQAPKPRNVSDDNLQINFSEKRNFPIFGIQDKKTDTGYFKISSPELTFLDLIYFESTMGGFNRIITILQELTEAMKINAMKEACKNNFPVSTIQRAGYIAENFLNNYKLATVFETILVKQKPKTILLKSAGEPVGDKNEKWKIIVNIQLNSDL